MIEIVVNYDENSKNFQIYESSTQTLLLSDTLGEGFRNLSLFLNQKGIINTNIIEEPGILYHIDSKTFSAIIQSNLDLLNRIKEIPSEFKNSASKFGTTLTSMNNNGSTKKSKPNFTRGSDNFKKGYFSGSKGSNFGKSVRKFGDKKINKNA